MTNEKGSKMERDTKIVLFGRCAMVARADVVTLKRKEKLVEQAAVLDRLVKESGDPTVLVKLRKVASKIIAINRKISRENIGVTFVQEV